MPRNITQSTCFHPLSPAEWGSVSGFRLRLLFHLSLPSILFQVKMAIHPPIMSSLGQYSKQVPFCLLENISVSVGKGGHTNTPSLSIPAILPIIIILSNPSNPTNPCRSFKSCQCIYVYRNPANPHNPFQSCQVCKQVLNGWVGGHLCCNRPAVCCWVETAPARLLDATAHSPMAFQHTNKYQRIPTHAHEYRANGVECNWMKKHSFSKKPGGKISFWSEYSTASPNSKWP